jgi:thiol:disulfide interchange protein DsbA
MKQMFSRTFGIMLIAFITLTGCLSESSQADEDIVEGKQYTVINPPIPTQVAAGQVEVTELFWYGCPHCYALEPTINKFLADKPANVVFQRIPATLSPRWVFHAKLYYVGKMLDPTGAQNVHGKIFESLQKQHRRIDTDEALVRFFTELGYAPDKINGALQSMEMNAMLAHSTDIGTQSKADSVPVVIVNGKYLTSPSMTGGEEKFINTVKYLVKRESK